jgi:hypothetical protein
MYTMSTIGIRSSGTSATAQRPSYDGAACVSCDPDRASNSKDGHHIDESERVPAPTTNAQRSALQRIRSQLRSYIGSLAWVARDGWRHSRTRVLLILAANGIGLATAATSLGGVMLYAKHAASDKPVRLLGLHLHFHDGLLFLLSYGSALTLLGILSAASIYYAEWLIQRVTRAYERLCCKRVLAIISEPAYRGWEELVDEAPRPAAARLMNIASRWTALTWRDMLRGVLPALTFLFAAAVLIHTDPLLTAILVPCAVGYLAPLYRINRRVSQQQRAYRVHARKVRGGMTLGMRTVLDSAAPPLRKSQWQDCALSDPGYEALMDAYYGRMIADKRVQLLNTIFFVVCVFVLFVFFGIAALWYERPWAEMVTYLIALRFAIGSLRAVSGVFVKFSRYFPELHAYSQFLQASQRLRLNRERAAGPGARWPNSMRVMLNGELRFGPPPAPDLELAPSRVLWVISTLSSGLGGRITYYDMDAIAQRLSKIISPRVDVPWNAAYLDIGPLVPEQSLLRNALGEAPTDDDKERFVAFLQALGVWQEIQSLPEQLETTAREALLRDLSDEAQLALSATHALREPKMFIFVSAGTLARLSEPFVQALVRLNESSCFIVIESCADGPDDAALAKLRDRIAGVIVMDGRQVVGAGDLQWLRANAGGIQRLVKSRRQAQAMEDDLEDDENIELMA